MTADGVDLDLALGEKVIVDSGTSLFLMPSRDRQQLVDAVAAKLGIECQDLGLPTCDCTDEPWPDLKLSIDG